MITLLLLFLSTSHVPCSADPAEGTGTLISGIWHDDYSYVSTKTLANTGWFFQNKDHDNWTRLPKQQINGTNHTLYWGPYHEGDKGKENYMQRWFRCPSSALSLTVQYYTAGCAAYKDEDDETKLIVNMIDTGYQDNYKKKIGYDEKGYNPYTENDESGYYLDDDLLQDYCMDNTNVQQRFWVQKHGAVYVPSEDENHEHKWPANTNIRTRIQLEAEYDDLLLMFGFTIECEVEPTPSPTNAPTVAPSEAPSMGIEPTGAPTFTDTTLYVRTVGCDYGRCSHANTDYTGAQCLSSGGVFNVSTTEYVPQSTACCVTQRRRRQLLGDPTAAPSVAPSFAPSDAPSDTTKSPTNAPSAAPSSPPSQAPSNSPSFAPSDAPSDTTKSPTNAPSAAPSVAPSMAPSISPSNAPSGSPSQPPSTAPSTAPSSAPSQSPSSSPSQPPSLAPSLAPSLSPSPAPTTRPTDLPTEPTEYPTDAPTESPTRAPSRHPTAHPIDTPVYMPTCQTLDYAYSCLQGTETGASPDPDSCAHKNTNYTGTGTIDLGDGVFELSTRVNLDDADLTFSGSSMTGTTLNYKGSATPSGWFGCRWHKCHIVLRDLALASDVVTSGANWQQFIMRKGGTLETENVLFDGGNVQTESNTWFWDFQGTQTVLIIRGSVFRHHDVKYKFDGVRVFFIDCIFEDNEWSDAQHTEAMFYAINGAQLTFENCIIRNNINNGRPMIAIYSGSSLFIANSTFANNTAKSTDDMLFIQSSVSSTQINITSTVFESNTAYGHLIVASSSSTAPIEINIEHCTFKKGDNHYDFRGDAMVNLRIYNTRFVHGAADYSLYLVDTKSIWIENTVWDTYTAQRIIDKRENGDTSIRLDNITMSSIRGVGVYITHASSTVYVLNSRFYDVMNPTWYGACLMLGAVNPDVVYVVKDTLFERCNTTGIGGGVYAYRPGAGSVFENLSFKDNYAGDHSADFYIMNTERADGEIAIEGVWDMSGASSGAMPSSIKFDNQQSNDEVLWRINMTGWTIRDTTNNVAMYVNGIDLNIDGLTAINNEFSAIYISNDDANTRIITHRVANSFFAQNGGCLVYNPSISLVEGSSLSMIGNRFEDNNGPILDVTLSDNTIQSIPIRIANSQIINHTSVGGSLFRISTDNGVCTTGTGHSWATDDQLTFSNVAFRNNKDSELMNIECVEVNMYNITLRANQMTSSVTDPMIVLSDYTRPHLDIFNAMDNKGRLLWLTRTYSVQFISHTVSNHVGEYIYYDATDTINEPTEDLTITDSVFNGCNTYYLGSDQAIIHIEVTVSRINTLTFLLDTITFDSNAGSMVMVENSDTNGVDLNVCPDLTDLDYNIQFTSCTFQSNIRGASAVGLLEFHWSSIEMDATNRFLNNDVHDVLLLVDSALTLDGVSLSNNTMTSFVYYERQENIGTYATALCVSDIDIDTTSTSDALFKFIQLTDDDYISISDTIVSSIDVHSFLTGYAASNDYAAIIRLQSLEVTQFQGNGIFIDLESIGSDNLFHIDLTDSRFINENGNYSLISIECTSSDTVPKTLTFDNLTFSGVNSDDRSLFSVVSTGDTPIDVKANHLTFTDIHADYYVYIEGQVSLDLGQYLSFDSIDKLIGARNALSVDISNTLLNDFVVLFEIFIDDEDSVFAMACDDMNFTNGVKVLSVDLGPGVSNTRASITFKDSNYQSLTLTNPDDHIFDIYSDGLSLDFTLNGGDFVNINSAANDASSYIYLDGGAAVRVTNIEADSDRHFLTSYDPAWIDISSSAFIDFYEAIRINRNNTIKWPDPSIIDIYKSRFVSSTDSNMIFVTGLSVQDELAVFNCNFTKSGIDVSLSSETINDNHLTTRLTTIGYDKTSVNITYCAFDQMDTLPVFTITDIATEDVMHSNTNLYHIIRPGIKLSHNQYVNHHHRASNTTLIAVDVFDSNDVFDIPRIQLDNEQFLNNNVSVLIDIIFTQTIISNFALASLFTGSVWITDNHFIDNTATRVVSVSGSSNNDMFISRSLFQINAVEDIMSVTGFGAVNFTQCHFIGNDVDGTLLPFMLSTTEISFDSCKLNNNTVGSRLLSFNGQGTVVISDTDFNYNTADILISAIGTDDNTSSLTLSSGGARMRSNEITQTIFEIGDATVPLKDMVLSGNTLLILIVSAVDLTIDNSQIADMSGIHMLGNNTDSNAYSIITITSTEFTNSDTLSSTLFYAIQAHISPNDVINIHDCDITRLPVRIYPQRLSHTMVSDASTVQVLFNQSRFDDSALYFDNKGYGWYPNVTLHNNNLSNTQLNVMERGDIDSANFTSTILFDDCVFSEIQGVVVDHAFLVAPITEIKWIHPVLKDGTFSYPFLRTQLTDIDVYPCSSLPTFNTHLFIDAQFINNVLLQHALFELQCSSLYIESSTFNDNRGVGLIDISGGNDIVIQSSTFIANSFTYYGIIHDHGNHGGSVRYELDSVISIDGTTFTRNTAERGSVLTVDYDNNETVYYGSSLVQFTDCDFIGNTANDVGGIVYVNIKDTTYAKSIQMIDSTIVNNTAVNHGGAIYAKDLNIHLSSSILSGNTAGISGGSMCILSEKCDEPSSSLTIIGDTSITECYAQIGGAIALGCVELMMGVTSNETDTNIEISDNTALTRGGAIHAHHSCVSSHPDSRLNLVRNTANYGAAFAFSAGVADGYCESILESEFIDFEDNEAYIHGAAVHVSYAPYTIYNRSNASNLLDTLPLELSYYNELWHQSKNYTTSLTISNADITDTTSKEYGSGVAVEFELFNDTEVIEDASNGLSVSIRIERAQFKNNHLLNTPYGGAAITYLAHHSSSVFGELIVNECDFIGYPRSTIKYGGVIWLDLNLCVGDLDTYNPENCSCYERYEDDIDLNIQIANSTFTSSRAIYGGSIYSKVPSFVSGTFSNNKGIIEGGAIYFGCALNADVSNASFEDIQCEMGHGGAAYFNRVTNPRIDQSIFTRCDAPFGGGAVAFIVHPMRDTSINIGSASGDVAFRDNSAMIGSSLFLSHHKIMIITDTATFSVNVNVTSISLTLNAINVDMSDAFSVRHVFVVLLPSTNATEPSDLIWDSAFEWTDEDMQLINDKTPFYTSRIDDSRFNSPFFIPLTLENENEWSISNVDDWNIRLDFTNLMNALSRVPKQLTFDVFLTAFQFMDSDQINTDKAFTLNMKNVVFEDNEAKVLSNVYINENGYRDVDITMNDLLFTRNVATGLTAFTVDHYGPNEDDSNEDGSRDISCNRCTFNQNIAWSSFTCLNVLGLGSSLSCTQCLFVSNTAGLKGSAMYIRDGSLALIGSQVLDNASPIGGNIFVDNSILSLRDSIFDLNTAVKGGGSAVSIHNIHKLIINKLDTERYDDLVSIDNCSFTNNEADTAGAIYIPIIDDTIITASVVAENITQRRRLLATVSDTPPVMDSVSIDTINSGLCDGVQIVINADFHSEDVSYLIQFDDDDNMNHTLHIHALYGCISEIPSSVQCITVTILDSFGDGLSYGDGTYWISWKGQYWESPSLGDYGQSETLIMCPTQAMDTTTLTVFVNIEDDESLEFLEFLDDELIPLFRDTIDYNIVFNIEEEDGADNSTCLSCSYGYCVCDVSSNITMQNVIAALCYLSTPSLRNTYNYTFQDIWEDDLNTTIIDDFCMDEAQTLLDNNYDAIQPFINHTIPAFYVDTTHVVDVAIDRIEDALSHMYSNCDLYHLLYDIMYPICASFDSSNALCQMYDNCYTSYCNTTAALLSITGNTTKYGHELLDYEPFIFDGIVGSSRLNIKHREAVIYGLEQYFDASLGCFNNTNGLTVDLINDTIPVLAVHLDSCQYMDMMTHLQSMGARAIVLITDIFENTKSPTPAPTPSRSRFPFNYDFWLPYECDITFPPSFDNYSSAFRVKKPQIDAELSMAFNTNIRSNDTLRSSTPNSVLYQVEANVTDYALFVPDTMIGWYLANYIELRLSLPIQHIDCIRKPERNESFTNAPTPEPTVMPTLSPTDRATIYDDIYIPIEVVTLSDAIRLTQIASDSASFDIGFLCDTAAPTPSPSNNPTESPTPKPTSATGVEEKDEFVIFTYATEHASQLSMGISFPYLDETWRYVFSDLCKFPISDVSNDDESVTFVTIDTVFDAFESICVEWNDGSNAMMMGWTEVDDGHWTTVNTPYYPSNTSEYQDGCASNGTSMRSSIGTMPRGTYCISLYTNHFENEKQYNLRMKELYEWTPAFITIQDSIFTNNTVNNGTGGAIAVITDPDVYEFTSVYMNNTIFDNNMAVTGGGTIYRAISESPRTEYDATQNQMSIFEMNNVQIYDSTQAIMIQLFSSQTHGIIFRNAFVLNDASLIRTAMSTNETSYKGLGGGIYAQGSTLYVANSELSGGTAWDGGCIWLKDSAVTLYNTAIHNCSASNDGGGLKATEFTIFDTHDLCLAAYYTNFSHNYAERDGGGAFLRLHGDGTSNHLETEIASRQSCMKVFDVQFNGNSAEEGEGDSVFLFVTNGHHSILDGDAPFSVVCQGEECVTAGSTLNNLCASQIVLECARYSYLANQNYDDCDDCSIVDDYVSDNILIADIPGSSVTFYVFGWDAFANPLNTSEYEIFVEADKATIITPEGTPTTQGQYYIVPMVINIGERNAEGTITISDQNGVAQTIDVKLLVKECDPGYYQKANEIDPNLFSCDLCDAEQYTLVTDKCRPCEQGLFCFGGNNIWVEENWYAKQGTSYNNSTRRRLAGIEALSASYVATSLCPPGYCCNTPGGCSFNESSSLCAANRDPDAVLCGRCLPGYSETLSSTGICSKCDITKEWLIPFLFIGGLCATYAFYWMGKRDRTVPHPFMTYFNKSMLFFYQVMAFLTFRSSSQILRPIAELANLNWDMSSDGTCLFKGVTSRGKLWLNLIVPGILSFDMLIFYIFIRLRTRHKFKTMQNVALMTAWLKEDAIAFQNALWSMFLIIYVQVTTSFIKLSLCFRFGINGTWHMWYAGNTECFDGGHVICMMISFFLIFCVPLLMLRVMVKVRREDRENHHKILSALTLTYRDQVWYYSAFNIFRRAILICLPLIPTNDLSIRAAFITFTVGLLLAVHCYLMPFKWSANNHLETFILIIAFFIATLNIVDDPPEWFPILTAVLALFPWLPWLFLGHDFAKGKVETLSTKIPELSFVWETVMSFDTQGEKDTGRSDVVSTNDTQTKMEGEIQLTAIEDQIMKATSSVAVSLTEDSEEEKEQKDPVPDTGLIQQSAVNVEDNLVKTIPFGKRKMLKIYATKKHGGMDEEDEDIKVDEMRPTISLFHKETIRHTKFGAERAWLPGSVPAWLNNFIWPEEEESVQEHAKPSTEALTEDPLIQAQVDEIDRFATEMFGDDMSNDIDYVLEDFTVRTGTSWIERNGELLPPTDDHDRRLDGVIRQRSKDAPLSLQQLQVDHDDKGGVNSQLMRLKSLRKSKRGLINTSTTYNIIRIKQKGWKKADEEQMNDEPETPTPQALTKEDSRSILEQAFADSEAEVELPPVQIKQFTPKQSFEYVVPSDYAYVDGLYSPKIFDEKWKSMVYCHKKCDALEMRVLSHGKSEADGVSIVATWIIVDIEAKAVLYQSALGCDLYKPPTKGWKRLLDENEHHAADIKDDLECDILFKEITSGHIPCPQIIDLKCTASEAISIEYDYKKVIVDSAPNLVQWIEFIAHNLTDPEMEDIFKIIYIKKEEKEEKKEEMDDEDDGLTADKRAYNVFAANNATVHEYGADMGNKMKKGIDWIRSTFEFDELELENSYRFTVKLANCITFTESILSDTCIPMTLPAMGRISNVECDAYASQLSITYEYDRSSYQSKSMNPLTFSVIVTPWPGDDVLSAGNDANQYFIDSDKKKISIAHSPALNANGTMYVFAPLLVQPCVFGQEYDMVMESENLLGITRSKSCKYRPVRVPPQPVIDSIDTDDTEWKMTINVSCAGYNDDDCLAWYELQLVKPPKNTLILEEKHYESPIVVSPIFAGQTYVVRVRAVNICASNDSEPYDAICIRTVPPIPVFTLSEAFDGSCVLSYECPNYQFYEGFAPQFELKTTPHHKQQPLTLLTQQRVEGLRNGDPYKFSVRARNKLGESEWSQVVKLLPLRKPQTPSHLITVSGPKCISIVWLSADKMEETEIQGKFVIISEPATLKKEVKNKYIVEFQALDDDKHYRFKVIATNNNFKSDSEWTQQVKPDAKKSKSQYAAEKQEAMDQILKIQRKIIVERKKTLRTKAGWTPVTPKSRGSPRRSSGKYSPKSFPKVSTPTFSPQTPSTPSRKGKKKRTSVKGKYKHLKSKKDLTRNDEWLYDQLKNEIQFNDIDEDGNEELDRDEFHQHFDGEGIDPLITDAIFHAIDVNKDSTVSKKEWLTWKHDFTQKDAKALLKIHSNKKRKSLKKQGKERGKKPKSISTPTKD
eukprot:649234_1